ncbi:MAG: hypothetical protein IPP30_01905 [Flavobacterium sp.]|nr:hypothetical protein [Flavobacterium sp.]
MSKRELKKYLNQLSKEQLEEQIVAIYDKFLPVKTYFNFVFNPNEERLIREAKLKISNEFFPLKGKRPKLRRSTAQKYIKHFISLGVDSFLIADLMLYAIEVAQTLTAEKPIKQDAFFKGILTSYEQAIRFVLEKEIYSEFSSRIIAIQEEAVKQDWVNKYEFTAIVERFEY